MIQSVSLNSCSARAAPQKLYKSFANYHKDDQNAIMILKVRNLDKIEFYLMNDSEYKFDYILVNKYDEYYKYIKKCSDYELVYKGKDKITFIFKRNI